MNLKIFQKLPDIKFKDVFSILLYLTALPISVFYKRKRKHLWLLCEYGEEARDNAFYLYKYLKENRPEIDAVYAINRNSIDVQRVVKLGEIVYYGSIRHWIYYLAAEVNISSHKGGKPNAALCYFLEVITGWLKNIRVFLQHGIIKDDLPFLHYVNTKISLFMCSTYREYRFVCRKFGYPKGSVALTGLCRYDNLKDSSNGKVIAIMPTWREWLYKTHKMKRIEHTKDFTQTGFYQIWTSLIEKILDRFQNTDITIILCLHRNMQQYNCFFKRFNESVQVVDHRTDDVQEVLKRAACLISDYSSVAIDFAYLYKPLAYYQMDYEQFRMFHLPEGYFDYEKDGFGGVFYSEARLIEWLWERYSQNFSQELVYKNRVDVFFAFHDEKHCERNFTAIQNFLRKREGDEL